MVPGRLLLAIAVIACAASHPPRPARAQSVPNRTLLTLLGSQSGERFGYSVAAAGDLNGDGFPDFAIGAPHFGPDRADSTGRVQVYFGGPALRSAADVVLEGAGRGHRFGAAIAGVGDVNGDGLDDLLVGAPGFPGVGAGQSSGRAYLFFGSPGFDGRADRVIPAFSGNVVGSAIRFGSSVTGLGDVNGDRFADWAIAHDSATVAFGTGGVHVYLGGIVPADRPASTSSSFSDSRARTLVCGVGDVDRDGLGDLAVGEPSIQNTHSRVKVFREPLLEYGSWWGYLESTAGLGASLAPAGDLDNNGFADLIAGGPRLPTGRAAVLLNSVSSSGVGSVSVRTFTSSISADSFGSSVAVGRFEEGGLPLLFVGACSDDVLGTNGGAIYYYRYESTGPRFLRTIRTVAGEYLGFSMAEVGDVDGNGEPELLVGAPHSSQGVANGGKAILLTFGPHTLLAPEGPAVFESGGDLEFRWTGRTPADLYLSYDRGRTWSRVASQVGGADQNSWRITLPAVVSPGVRALVTSSTGQSWRGSDTTSFDFSILRATRHRPLVPDRDTISAAPPAGGRCGQAIASGGDWTGDGHPDLALGAPGADGAAPRSGRVWIRSGDPQGPNLEALDGESAGDHFGSAIALGDLDGDGRPDLLVGAPRHSGTAPGAGRVYFYRRPPREESPGVTDGDGEGEAFGSALAMLGDWNADGRADVAIAAPRAASTDSTGGGHVVIFTGEPNASLVPLLRLAAPPEAIDFGASLAALDFDGDGHRDLAVSVAFRSHGREQIFIYRGGPAADARADFRLSGPGPFEGLGASLDAGDVTGDGVDDLLAGAPDAEGAAGRTGRAYLFAGASRPAASPLRVYEGRTPGERFGAAVHVARDLDADGGRMVVVGAPESGGGLGACRSFRGAQGGPEWEGSVPGARFGASIGAWNPGASAGGFRALVASPLAGAAPAGTAIAAIRAPRHLLQSPRPGDRWFVGGRYDVRWRGAESADVELTLDGGNTWTVLATGAGGAEENVWSLLAPHASTDSAWIRLRPTSPDVAGEESMTGFFRISTEATLREFRAELSERGVRLTWQALPGVGDQGWSGYRLYRIGPGEAGEQRIGPSLVQESEWQAFESRRGATYILKAVDGHGEEHELGRLTVPAGQSGIRIWPVPSGEFAPVRMAMFPPVDEAGRTPADFEVVIFDVAGREVLQLARGGLPSRVGEIALAWDRRSATGRAAEVGIYFVLARVPSQGWEEKRRLVLLR